MSAGWLGSRWALGAGAWTAFSLVAWFVGELLVLGELRPLESPAARITLIGIAAAAWLGWEVGRELRTRRESDRLLAHIAGAGAEADSAARAAQELAVLRARFDEAAAVLKKARFKSADGERRFVHELPWYVFIGAPGSGKTTALVNAGLSFPLGAKHGDPAVQGVGGTRNCDWWFTENAVLLDTAGRYTTQESDQKADAAAWYGFLDLLKQFRPREPLNGAIVTLSVSDLMLWSPAERMRYAGHVRMRLAELYARLGVRFPIYLLVTKSDLLAGFMEFFGELDAAGREAVWGVTFEHPPAADGAGGAARGCAAEFAALEERLYSGLVDRLQEERDLQRRAAIYRFPQQFHSLGPLVAEFVTLAFAQKQDGHPPLLRGVYFTSGTQEGSPIDRVLGTIARSFNLERAALPALGGTGKSFFLKRLLREVIFPEAGLAGTDEALERRRRRVRSMAYASIAALSAALALAWTASYFGNRDYVASAQARSTEARRQLEGLPALRRGDEATLVAALNVLRDLPGGYRERGERAPVGLGFGLYQGEKLSAQARRAYRNALRDALLPWFAQTLEETMRSARGREAIGQALEAYLALYDARGADPEAVEAAALRVWHPPQVLRQDLLGHLRASLEEKPLDLRHPRDDALIKEARQRLAAVKPS